MNKIRSIEHKGFSGSVDFSEEDQCFYGKIQNIRSLVMYEGTDLESLKKDFKEAVDDYLEAVDDNPKCATSEATDN